MKMKKVKIGDDELFITSLSNTETKKEDITPVSFYSTLEKILDELLYGDVESSRIGFLEISLIENNEDKQIFKIERLKKYGEYKLYD